MKNLRGVYTRAKFSLRVPIWVSLKFKKIVKKNDFDFGTPFWSPFGSPWGLTGPPWVSPSAQTIAMADESVTAKNWLGRAPEASS